MKASSKPGKRMNGSKAGRKKCYIDSSSNKQMKKQERRDGFGSGSTGIKIERESLIMAAQEQAICTNVIKAKIVKT